MKKNIFLATLGLISSGMAEEQKNKIEVEEKQVLVAYYSRSGNTRYAAEKIQQAIGGTLLEIVPKNAYPEDYGDCVNQAKAEIKKGFQPELINLPKSLDQYKVIFVGSPNWWGTMAPPVLTFLSSYSLKGKNIIPFLTHGGGGMQNHERDVKKSLQKSDCFTSSRIFW